MTAGIQFRRLAGFYTCNGLINIFYFHETCICFDTKLIQWCYFHAQRVEFFTERKIKAHF